MNVTTEGKKWQPELSFFLSEILGSRVFMNGKKVGKLVDLVIKENGALPVVTQLCVSRPFGEASVVPWECIKVIQPKRIEICADDITLFPKEPAEDAILLRMILLTRKPWTSMAMKWRSFTTSGWSWAATINCTSVTWT